MSFLYPLFFAGIVAVALPIIAHMRRNRTSKRMPFSSLMFVPVTKPQFKNRSKLEHLLLLFLRCLILCLLAFAFSRPFFPKPTEDKHISLSKRIVILIDTSASMRREGLWEQAQNQVKQVLSDTSPTDRVSIIHFDKAAETIMEFEEWTTLDPARRNSLALDRLSNISPGFAATDLGQALIAAAEAIEEDQVNDSGPLVASRQVILVSDIQQGSKIEALQGYQWPHETPLHIRPVRPEGPTNASIQLIADTGNMDSAEEKTTSPIRIMNSADADSETFHLDWAKDASADQAPPGMDVYVAPGRSAALTSMKGPGTNLVRRLILTGDDHDFDNTLYLAPQLPRQISILYIGSDKPDDTGQMLYYLRQAFTETRAVKPDVIQHRPDESLTQNDLSSINLVIMAEPVNAQTANTLRRHLESGATMLLAVGSPDDAKTLASLAGIETIDSTEAEVNKYAMLGRIDSRHPMLSVFSEPRFGDFTQIHFWKYRKIDTAQIPRTQVLAWYDNDDPAWLQVGVSKGSLIMMTGTWNRLDSDIALSSKFVPLLYSILEYSGALAGQKAQYFTGDPIHLPAQHPSDSSPRKITKPDDSTVTLPSNEHVFTQTDLPGIYTLESEDSKQQFAVNLPVSESRTSPLDIDEIEKAGVRMGQSNKVLAEHIERKTGRAQLAEIEYEQKIWRWVLIAVLVTVLIETWLAGWFTRPAAVNQGDQK